MSYIHERIKEMNGMGNGSGRSLIGRFSGAVGGGLVPEIDSSFDPYENREWVTAAAFDEQTDLYHRALSGELTTETVEKAVSGLGHTSINGANGNERALVPRPRTDAILVTPANASSTMVPQAAKVSPSYL